MKGLALSQEERYQSIEQLLYGFEHEAPLHKAPCEDGRTVAISSAELRERLSYQYCAHCGQPFDAQAAFCTNCGTAVGQPPQAPVSEHREVPVPEHEEVPVPEPTPSEERSPISWFRKANDLGAAPVTQRTSSPPTTSRLRSTFRKGGALPICDPHSGAATGSGLPCTACGAIVPHGVRFCTQCGKPV